ncbi:sporulation integral membrane protein YtvI [Pelotomaculum terephthalicicum JT]|uniref:sporulation integral membrane protein YtvI n=1 Tax=Pelotomaculum TaxID=191373 RepID=UPI0009C63F65|nr:MULTISPECIES: sporulation integral membrane protein YtvI [Pelotomaculum]MCG9967774.1 sporulation integral membrane protein YtvI [Pelotomaculum terephthalicicum JT]OPX85392.1 MAG: pheromone autoinducer 2 transporter [Pelotomaculum sp. PtaB.Bin117]
MPKKLVMLIYAIIIALIVMIAVKYILPVLVPFIIALVFSIIMEPIIVALQHKGRLPRGVSTFIAMLIVFGGIGVIFTVVTLKLVAELVQLSVSLPGIAADLRVYFQDLIEKATTFYVNLPPYVTSSLEQNINSIAANIEGFITRVVNSILQYISLVPGTLTVLLVSGLATYFLARDRHLIVQLLLRFVPEPWGEKSVEVMREISAAFLGYLRAQAILISMTAIISITGLYIIGAKYALTMGLLIGFFDLIPVLGPAGIYLPWLAWSFASGDTGFGIKLAILYAVVVLIRQIFETKIVSASLGLHPLATLVAMYAGLKLMGVLGLVLGPVLLIGVQAALKSGILNIKTK